MTVRARAMRHAALLLVSGLLLSGCMSLEDLAGFHAPPREDTSGTLVDVDQAERIVTRVLQAAGAAESATGEQAAAERAAVLTGTALEVATARAAAGSTPADTLSRPEPATVLGLSQGPQFPRFILATSPDARSGRQYLDVLVSSSVTQPYQLENRVPMLPGPPCPAWASSRTARRCSRSMTGPAWSWRPVPPSRPMSRRCGPPTRSPMTRWTARTPMPPRSSGPRRPRPRASARWPP